MRIAICYAGFLRNFEHTFARAKMFMFDVWRPDVFFAGYPNKDPGSVGRFHETYKPKLASVRAYTDQYRDELRSKYNADGFWNRHFSTNVDGMLSLYTLVKEANELKTRYEQEQGFTYDVVIRARHDMFWSRPVMIGELNAAKAGFLLVPGTWDFKSINAYAMTDIFAMSTSAKMNVYSGLIDHLQTYNKDGCACHHESFVGWHAHKTGLEDVRISNEPHLWHEYPIEFNHLPLEERDRKLY